MAPKVRNAVPMEGQDYKSRAAVLKDWDAGKTFVVTDLIGRGPVSKKTLPVETNLRIHYDGGSKTVEVEGPSPKPSPKKAA